MRTTKPLKLGILCQAYDSGEATCFAVSVLAFFPFAPPSAPPAPLLPEVEMWRVAGVELGHEILDEGMPKTRGELLVSGSVYAPGGPQPVCAPRVALGTIDKTLRVVGDRVWKDGAPSDPAPFTEIPLSYDKAFGGPGYELNPTGKGVAPLGTEPGAAHPLPNIEDLRHLVVSTEDRPQPAGFGAYHVTWKQRASKRGTYDDAWRKERYPGFPRDMDPTFFNRAPDDQQLDGYFQGDETFTLEHLHPDKPLLEGKLPSVRARVFITQKGPDGEAFREIETHLDTVRLFPRVERGVLIFHGSLEITEDDAADVVDVVIACEDLDDPKPVGHYKAALAQRLDEKMGHLFLVRERELMPAPRGRAPVSAADAADTAAFATEGLLRKNIRRGAEAEIERLRQAARDRGLDPAKAGIPELPPEEKEPDLDDLSLYFEQLIAKADQEKEDAERKQAEAAKKRAEGEKLARERCTAKGLDYDEVVKAAKKGTGGPPKFSAEKELEKLRAMAFRAKARGVRAPEVEAALANPVPLHEVERRLMDAYRRFAHGMPEAARMEGDRAASVRREVTEGMRAGRSFAGMDLTGADLSGLKLTRGDFRGALLECANLAGAELRGADLTDAVLTRADLTKATLFAAKLAGANLGSAKLAGADAGGADLTGAVLVKADLTGASFQDAQLGRADFSEAIFAGADLTRVTAPEATFQKTDLSTVKVAGADLRDATFLECTVAGVDFTGAKLTGAVFVTALGDRAVFRDADLDNLRVVKDSSFQEADFRGARLEGANLRGTRLARADLGGARLARADLSECDLRGATLTKADARRAQFVRADLSLAVMKSVNLMEGSLAKANLAGADLRGANLFRVDFGKARTDGATNLTGANTKRMRVVPPRGGSNAAR